MRSSLHAVLAVSFILGSSTAFSALASQCAPTKQEIAKHKADVAAEYRNAESEFPTLLANVAGSKDDNRKIQELNVLIKSTLALPTNDHFGFSKAYCTMTERALETAYNEADSTFSGDKRIWIFAALDQIGVNANVPFETERRAFITGSVNGMIADALRKAYSCNGDVSGLGCIDVQYNRIAKVQSTPAGKSAGAEHMLTKVSSLYDSVEKRVANQGAETPLDLSKFNTRVEKGDFRNALGMLRGRKETPELKALKNDVQNKWVASLFGKADALMKDVAQKPTEKNIREAADAIRSACNLADDFGSTPERCRY